MLSFDSLRFQTTHTPPPPPPQTDTEQDLVLYILKEGVAYESGDASVTAWVGVGGGGGAK